MVYSTTDAASANPLLKDFAALYPGITVDYTDMNSTEVYSRFIAEVAAGTGTADVVTDGERSANIANGEPLMGLVTAMGCAGSARYPLRLAIVPITSGIRTIKWTPSQLNDVSAGSSRS